MVRTSKQGKDNPNEDNPDLEYTSYPEKPSELTWSEVQAKGYSSLTYVDSVGDKHLFAYSLGYPPIFKDRLWSVALGDIQAHKGKLGERVFSNPPYKKSFDIHTKLFSIHDQQS